MKRGYTRVSIRMADQTSRAPEFRAFRERLEQAIAQRDLDGLVQCVATERIVSEPDGVPGMASFLEHWDLTHSPKRSAIWRALKEALRYGCGYDEATDAFAAPQLVLGNPYAAEILDRQIDQADRAIITGIQVNVRSTPSLRGEQVGQLSYEVVKVLGSPDPATRQTIGGEAHPWWEVVLPSGERGFVFGKYVRPWNDYRARFEKVDGEWKLARFARIE